ncbi:MAG TPA: XRE family transcriptional regulator [Frankiaceae bacterium]|jgi:transcriptional regulator with XRE-family HTH domain|nr:XRE family transcriptional regulator [Frankiaceae bacterium]
MPPDSGAARRALADPALHASLGDILRAARLDSGKTQRQVAAEAGVSAGLIGQFETGRTQPSVATLLAVARVLQLSLDELFADGENAVPLPATPESKTSTWSPLEARVARVGERDVITLEGGVTWELLTPEIDHDLTFMLVTYPPGSSSSTSSQLLRHDDFEYFYITSGQLHVKVGFEETVLAVGDSMSFDSTRPHRFVNGSDTATATGLWCVRTKTGDQRSQWSDRSGSRNSHG